MTPKVFNRSSAVLAVAAAATLVAAGTVSASTTITPANTPVTATSNDLRILTPGYTMRCTNVSGTGTTPAAPGNVNPSTGGIDIDITSVSMSGCKLNGQTATVAAAGTWKLKVDNDGASPQGSLIIPVGGAVVTVPSSGCSITVGASTIGPLPYTKPSVTASNSGTVNFDSTGGGVCPPAGAGTANLTGMLTFSPGVDVTP
ncbi:hypothetical protein [Prescottella sp. R16]|uniref:hypothetical protein n=1 Tax=Prescottella sp. R16 TaxID=3064529 RepID=UPI00272ED365|nr:hypothetical protein [Prescottella sp. R16]